MMKVINVSLKGFSIVSMDFLKNNWSSIIVFISAIGVAIAQMSKDEDVNPKYKSWINIISMIMAFAGGIGGLVNSYQSQLDQATMQKTLDSTKQTSESVQRLTQLNLQLSTQIEQLQKLNNQIASNTELLTKDGNSLISKNLQTTNNLNALTQNAKYLVDKVYDEQTGGNSLPIVRARTFKDQIPFNPKVFQSERRQPTGKYLMILDLTNTGENKIIDLYVSSSRGVYRGPPLINKLFEGNLLPKQSVNLITDELATLIPDQTEPPLEDKDLNYDLPDFGDMMSEPLWITVSWRTTTYVYIYSLKGNHTPNLDVAETYLYKRKNYTYDEFIKQLLQEREMERKQKISKKD